MELSTTNYDFAGWATCCNKLCSDGRTILPDAFKHQDGQVVPLVWNHQHNDVNNVLGKALLHSRDGGIFAYAMFNDTESGRAAKELVAHGDVESLSIYANQLKHDSRRGVMHGVIRELSIVLAGANPGAHITTIGVGHGAESEEEAIIYNDEEITLYHSDEQEAKEEANMAEETKKKGNEETVADVWKRIEGKLDDTEMNVVHAIIGQALEEKADDDDNDDKEEKTMKHNAFDNDTYEDRDDVLSHADEEAILHLAKQSAVGSLQQAMEIFAKQNSLKHADFVDADGNDAIETLYPEYKLLKPGAPELIQRDLSWVDHVINGIHKSPITRIRTRNADARSAELRAKGYQKKGDEKKISGQIKLISRTTDPQTVYIKDELDRDDIIDITDFDVVEYKWRVMRDNMKEVLALAALVGDLREDTDPDKIHEEHIRPIWKDDELYTIHAQVDMEAMRTELNGTNTGANFGENYIYAEAIVQSALYAREKYKGSGSLEFYCTPHLLNVMLLARDLNGRRIYSSKSDLAAALNVTAIHTVEQFEGLTRTDDDGKAHKLLGLFVNLSDYQFGCSKGGELTKFDDFDIDFNKYKYLLETRKSGSLTKLWSAIALEEPVATAEAEG